MSTIRLFIGNHCRAWLSFVFGSTKYLEGKTKMSELYRLFVGFFVKLCLPLLIGWMSIAVFFYLCYPHLLQQIVILSIIGFITSFYISLFALKIWYTRKVKSMFKEARKRS